MALGKEELLASIAAAGSAGRAAYDQANQAIAAQQQEAVRMALASSVAGNAPMGAQDEIQRIVSQPYQTRTAQITSNRASMDDWYNRQSAMQGTYLDTALRLAELQAAGALGGGSGGGGGGGGSGGGGGGDVDWDKNLAALFGTREAGFDAIANEAKALGLNSVENPDLPRYLQTRQYATSAYGVPEAVAESEFLPSKYAYSGDKDHPGVMESALTVGNRKQFKQFKRDAKTLDRNTKGNQSYWTRQAIQTAKRRVKKKK